MTLNPAPTSALEHPPTPLSLSVKPVEWGQKVPFHRVICENKAIPIKSPTTCKCTVTVGHLCPLFAANNGNSHKGTTFLCLLPGTGQVGGTMVQEVEEGGTFLSQINLTTGSSLVGRLDACLLEGPWPVTKYQGRSAETPGRGH